MTARHPDTARRTARWLLFSFSVILLVVGPAAMARKGAPVHRAAGWRSAKSAAAKKRPAPKHARRGKPVRVVGNKHDARKKLRNIQQEIRHKQQALRQTKQRQKRVSQAIHQNTEGLHGAQANLRTARSRLTAAESELAEAERRLAEAKQRLAAHIELLRGRLVQIYKHGDVGYATALLHAHDMWDLTSRGYLLQRVVRRDTELLARIKDAKAEIAAQTASCRERRNQVDQLRAEAEQHVHVVGARLAAQRETQEELSQDRAQLESQLHELEQNSQQVERMLRAFEARPDIARQIPHPWVGGFLRPVPGQVSSGFGMRYHPILHVTKLHTGVDLAAAAGTPIHAAGDGLVVHAGWFGGYGNCVIIAHGNGRSTLYGHCSSVSVSTGRRVQRGQVIGRVGSTGFSTGPHLHFEVRKNGVPVNPLSQ